MYATAGETLELVVRAVDVDPFEKATIYFTGLQPDPVTNAMPAGVGFPEVLPFKYGCGETPYVDCDEEVNVLVKYLHTHARAYTRACMYVLMIDTCTYITGEAQ